jgi:uracil-DNA glycosylase
MPHQDSSERPAPSSTARLPHPIVAGSFASPVPVGTRWPGDLATAGTPVATTGQEVVELAAGAEDLATLDARVSRCRACPRLVRWRETVAARGKPEFAGQPYWGRPVPGFGPADAPVLVVGLAPAAQGANRTGRMFTGDRSGEWLFASLHRVGDADLPTVRAAGDGQRLHRVRLTAAVRCAPPGNKPSTGERDVCAPWLDREIVLLGEGLRVLVALGAFGWAAALAAAGRLGWQVPRPRPKFGHGARVELSRPSGPSVTLLGSYHVSQQNTFTGRLTERMLDTVLSEALSLVGQRGESSEGTPGISDR